MLKDLLARAKREPLVVLTAAVALAMTLYKVYAEGMPLADVFSEEYVEYVFVAATGLIGRFMVFAPESVREMLRELLEGSDE